MKSTAMSLAVIALLSAGSAYAQHASKAPTAEIDHEPRSADSLDRSRPTDSSLQDSRLVGGSSETLPESRVPLPSLCDIDPDHPSCDDESGGGGGGDGASATANCGFALSEEAGFTQAMTVNRGVGSASCFQGGMYSHRPGGSTLINVAAVFSMPIAQSSVQITWHGACAGQTGSSCTTPAKMIDIATATVDASWEAQATMQVGSQTIVMNFSAIYAACGVVGDLDCR